MRRGYCAVLILTGNPSLIGSPQPENIMIDVNHWREPPQDEIGLHWMGVIITALIFLNCLKAGLWLTM